MKLLIATALVMLATPALAGAPTPPEVTRLVPREYSILTSVTLSAGGRTFYVVGLRSRSERESRSYLGDADRAPARPLIIYERTAHGVIQVGRNDRVIDRAGDAGLAGNGCDPFEDGSIAVKGAYFTVENGVSCGAHWTDYVTFRFDPRLGFVFDNSRFQSEKLNPSDDPDAEALVPDVQRVVRGSKDRAVPFSQWRPR